MSQSLAIELSPRSDTMPAHTRTWRRVRAIVFGAVSRQVDIARQREQLAQAPDADLGRATGCKC